MAKTENEHFNRLWEFYLDMTGNGTRKQDALKFFLARSKEHKQDNELFANDVIAALKRLYKHRQELTEKGEFTPPWTALAVYINQKRYMDDIKVKKEFKQAVNFCAKHPDRRAHHNFPPFMCSECMALDKMVNDPENKDTTDLMRDKWKELDLTRKTAADCRRIIFETTGIYINLPGRQKI